ncbi:MAG: HEAT repeat domain-containing protein [Spirochaetales bacterium]|nr:HEAT repeat domain-containing protein [Spirochaetales bacterium]
MNEIFEFIRSLPPLLLFLGGGSVFFIIIFCLWRVIAFKRIKKILKSFNKDPDLTKTVLLNKYGAGALLRRSSIIEQQARILGLKLIRLIGMDTLWIGQLLKKKTRKHLLRVLEFAPDKGLFSCFFVCLKKRYLFIYFKKWLEKSTGGGLKLGNIAHSCRGERFDGKAGLALCNDKVDELRELTGDVEWNVRYFAINMLLHEKSIRVLRALWDSLTDPQPLIREIVITHFKPQEKEKFYNVLFQTVCDDPVYQVRARAWDRIQKEYRDLYHLEPRNFSAEQAFHILELLRPDNKQEQNFALTFLDHSNLELRFAAAQYLEKCGILNKLFLEVDFSDMQIFERNFSLLKKASEVNVTSFLACIANTQNRASLTIASSILVETGDVDFISILTRKVFAIYDGGKEMEQLYRATVRCVAERGTEEALFFYKYELEKRRMQKQVMSILLQMVPARAGFILYDILFAYFLQPFFEPKEQLRMALKKMPVPKVLSRCLEIIRAKQGRYQHIIRIEALKLLGELNLHYCLEIVLEHLPQLPLAEARTYSAVFSQYPRELVAAKIKKLFNTNDNRLRAALVTILPQIGHKELQQLVRDSLTDMDPDVRIASVWALVEFDDLKALNAAFEILRDPVKRVREQAAEAFGKAGSNANLDRLKNIVLDADEAADVKLAAIKGLACSGALKAIDVLLSLLDKCDDYTKQIIQALSAKKQTEELMHLIEGFRNGSPKQRQGVIAVIEQSGQAVEEPMLELLKQSTHSLKPYIAELLENTGLIESTIRKLKDRNPNIRQHAADILSLIGTHKAYRGLVFAARDPHEEVRVAVVKALERLNSEEGKLILKELRQDPDKKVRRYTVWALEKLKIKV